MREQLQHDLLVKRSHDEQSRQDYVVTMRKYLASRVAPRCADMFTDAVESAFKQEHGRTPDTRAEMRDAMNDDPLDEPARRIYGGVEFNFSDFFFLRGGMHQGYWTAGLEIAMFNWQLQFAAYGEEVGDLTVAEELEEGVPAEQIDKVPL